MSCGMRKRDGRTSDLGWRFYLPQANAQPLVRVYVLRCVTPFCREALFCTAMFLPYRALLSLPAGRVTSAAGRGRLANMSR